MDVNDDAGCLENPIACIFIASKLTPTGLGAFTDSAYIHEHCGSGLAREGGGTFSIDVA